MTDSEDLRKRVVSFVKNGGLYRNPEKSEYLRDEKGLPESRANHHILKLNPENH
jgi:hypothetical protein